MRAAAVIATLALAVGAALTVVGCGQDEDPELAALEREDVAAVVPPGGTLDFRTEDRAHTSLGKPGVAHLTRVFVFDDAASAARGKEAVIDTAQASGWDLNLDRATVIGSKTLDTGDVMLEIAEYQDGGRFKVSVSLEHRACPPASCPSTT